jgi:hypothetical protein
MESTIMPTSETSTYKYGDIVEVLPGNEDLCPDGLAVVIHTEDRPDKIILWVLNSEDDIDIYNPPSKADAPLCWLVSPHNVVEVDNRK